MSGLDLTSVRVEKRPRRVYSAWPKDVDDAAIGAEKLVALLQGNLKLACSVFDVSDKNIYRWRYEGVPRGRVSDLLRRAKRGGLALTRADLTGEARS